MRSCRLSTELPRTCQPQRLRCSCPSRRPVRRPALRPRRRRSRQRPHSPPCPRQALPLPLPLAPQQMAPSPQMTLSVARIHLSLPCHHLHKAFPRPLHGWHPHRTLEAAEVGAPPPLQPPPTTAAGHRRQLCLAPLRASSHQPRPLLLQPPPPLRVFQGPWHQATCSRPAWPTLATCSTSLRTRQLAPPVSRKPASAPPLWQPPSSLLLSQSSHPRPRQQPLPRRSCTPREAPRPAPRWEATLLPGAPCCPPLRQPAGAHPLGGTHWRLHPRPAWMLPFGSLNRLAPGRRPRLLLVPVLRHHSTTWRQSGSARQRRGEGGLVLCRPSLVSCWGRRSSWRCVCVPSRASMAVTAQEEAAGLAADARQEGQRGAGVPRTSGGEQIGTRDRLDQPEGIETLRTTWAQGALLAGSVHVKLAGEREIEGERES
mmetsp:Transcript_11056/g.31278  ORF Transcript_11056/g.31278 Transcript_11056/m.31278 type:complete len:428 (+) Transcript_11056:2961-4244(+)